MLLVTALAALLSCTVAKTVYDELPILVLKNTKGMQVHLSPVGATIQKLLVPGSKPGSLVDVALGHDNIALYTMDPHPSFGAIVGRVENRITNANFTLDGKTYTLLANEGTSSIHGGAVRFSKQIWDFEGVQDRGYGQAAVFKYFSKDGEAGYPGNLQATVTYFLPKNKNQLEMQIQATTDKPTIVNLVQHSYFNLKGAGKGDVLDHEATIWADEFTPSDPGELYPNGTVASVEGTIYDFRKTTPFRKNYAKANGGPHKGFDLNYVLIKPQGPNANPQTKFMSKAAAQVREPVSGLTLKVLTDAPGVHLYTGNFLTGDNRGQAGPGKGGVYYPQYGGFCLETQAWPNSVNTPNFPSIVLRPGQIYQHALTYQFFYS